VRAQEPPDDLVRFWRELYPTLVGGLTLHSGSRADAEELAQETLVRVWENWRKVSVMGSPTGWTWRVAMNLTRSRWRRTYAERRALERTTARAATEGHEGPDAAAALAVREAVAQLPERQKRALILRYWADLPVDDVAELMGCAPGTVKSHTHKAVESLRGLLDLDEPVEVPEHA
jgi:RNA polymerase sigma-70 factor, ECF subfamily